MKLKVEHGRFAFSLHAGIRFSFWVAKKVAKNNRTAKKILTSCSKEIIRTLKQYKRKYGSFTLVEVVSAEGERVLITL